MVEGTTANQEEIDSQFDGWMHDARRWIDALEREAAANPKAFYRGCELGLGRQVVVRAALRQINELRARVGDLVRA
jgi:hypothetical protein